MQEFLRQKSPDHAGTGLIRIWCKAATLLQHSNAWTFAVQATFQRGRPFFPSPCNGLVRSDGSAFYSEIAPHYKVHCRFPASQPASQSVLLLGDFTHCLITMLIFPSTSPQLRYSQLEMTITCSVIVGCVFFQPPRWYFVGRQGWRKEGSLWHIKPERLLQSFIC